MNELQIFSSIEFGEIRAIKIEDEPWFIGRDVAQALGYGEGKSLANAVANHVDDLDRSVTEMMTEAGKRNMVIINESGLYALIFGSKLESAKRFKRWVTAEVLPAIRKNGGYIAGQETMTDDEILAKALLVAQNKIAERDRIIEEKQKIIGELQPKANYVDTILQSKSLVLTTQIAKDYGMSARRLNQILKEMRIQYKVGGQWVLYSKYQSNGYVHSRTINITRANGESDTTMQTEWTQKGRLFLYEALKKKGYVPVIEQAEGSEK